MKTEQFIKAGGLIKILTGPPDMIDFNPACYDIDGANLDMITILSSGKNEKST